MTTEPPVPVSGLRKNLRPKPKLPPGFQAFFDAIGTVQGVIEMIVGAITGGIDFTLGGLSTYFDDFRDFQRDLNERTELLESVSGYCNMAMSQTWRLPGGQATPIPYDSRIGPKKNAEPFQGAFTTSSKLRRGILITAPGTWDARARVTTSGGSGSNNAQLYLSLWHKDTKTLLSEARFDTFIGDRRSNTIIETFVIPPELAGKVVVCCTFAHPGFWWSVIGGDRASRLSVSRWDIDSSGRIPTNTGDAPDAGEYD